LLLRLFRGRFSLANQKEPEMLIYRTSSTGVRCGNRQAHLDTFVYHADAAAVKACFLGDGTCTWLSELPGYNEDGEKDIVECGAALHVTDRGWHCNNGHDHVTAEIRQAEAWDYASDEGEARELRRYGVDAVAMSGGSI
jgi:hypothetical protein